MALEVAPSVQVLLGLVLLSGALAGALWMLARALRTTLLVTGQRPSLRAIVRAWRA
jgi:hypothetical protein